MDDEEESLIKKDIIATKDQPKDVGWSFFSDFIFENCAVNEILRNRRVERFRELRYNARKIFYRRLN